MPARKDLTGQRFGRLVAVRFHERRKYRSYWLFKCDCGNDHVATQGHVTQGTVKSCGCYRVDWAKEMLGGATHLTHGDTSRTQMRRLYGIWSSMKQRCHNPNVKAFRWYGARGISVCSEWLDYSVFREWAHANGYTDELTIDRLDPDQGYSPANCRWVTLQENASRGRAPGTVT